MVNLGCLQAGNVFGGLLRLDSGHERSRAMFLNTSIFRSLFSPGKRVVMQTSKDLDNFRGSGVEL